MLHWKRTLNHRDDHTTVLTGVEIPMGGVRWHEYGFSSFDRRLIVADDDDSLPFPAEDDLISNRMAMEAVLLTWFEAVDVAMELIGLPDTPPHKPAW